MSKRAVCVEPHIHTRSILHAREDMALEYGWHLGEDKQIGRDEYRTPSLEEKKIARDETKFLDDFELKLDQDVKYGKK